MAIRYKVKKSLKANENKFPLNRKDFKKAHLKANKEEKKKYPSGFKKLTKLEHGLKHDELLGHSTKSGKIEVSSKVPKKYRKEVALHESVENKALCKKCKKKRCTCK
jgi:hypothetical protein